jgi:hypothetical protein
MAQAAESARRQGFSPKPVNRPLLRCLDFEALPVLRPRFANG